MRPAFAILLLAAIGASSDTGAAEKRFVAEFESGRQTSGEAVENWALPGQTPRLDGQPLLEGDDRIAWLLDTGLEDRPAPSAMIEFVNGDRFPGVVLGYSPAAASGAAVAAPEHLIVAPVVPLRNSRNEPVKWLRVPPSMVRRLWTGRFTAGMAAGIAGEDPPGVVTSSPYVPGTLLARDGQRLTFRRLRFHEDGLTLLTDTGLVRFELAEVAELNLPQSDGWAAYYDELAALSPQLEDRLVQVETVAGLAATTSMARYRAMVFSDRRNPDEWYHLIQPAWSLDAFAVRHGEVRARRWFSPERVPLSHVAAASETNRSQVHAAWRSQRNRNAYGGPLAGGGRLHGWGIGVHGAAEMAFPLPPTATAFETAVGIDAVAGSGGCLQARVSLRPAAQETGRIPRGDGTRGERVLLTSDVLRGSERVQQSGRLALDAPGRASESPSLLVLKVDSLDGTAGADPLDVRDAADWLEPVLHLDRAALEQELNKRRWQPLLAGQGWEVEAGETASLHQHWNAERGEGASFRFALRSSGDVALRRKLSVPSSQAVLLVSANRLPESAAATVGIHVGETLLAERELPLRYSGDDEPQPLMASLGRWSGESIDVRILVARLPGQDAQKDLIVDWRSIVPAERPGDLTAEPAAAGRFSAAPAALDPEIALAAREKDVRNRWLELRVMIEEGLDDDACKLLAGLPLEDLLTPLEHPDGSGRKTTLAKILPALVADRPGLLARMRERYAGISDLRLERAMADCDRLRVAAIAMQFPGTEAAARSQAWLGDRQLARGAFASAAEFYRRALPGIVPSQRRQAALRLEMAESLGRGGGP